MRHERLDKRLHKVELELQLVGVLLDEHEQIMAENNPKTVFVNAVMSDLRKLVEENVFKIVDPRDEVWHNKIEFFLVGDLEKKGQILSSFFRRGIELMNKLSNIQAEEAALKVLRHDFLSGALSVDTVDRALDSIPSVSLVSI